MQLTNAHNIALPVAVYLASDSYDYKPGSISVTSLMKPVRRLLLAPKSTEATDISSLVKQRAGQAIHDSIERAWTHNSDRALKALGYPDLLIQKIKVNPDPATLSPDSIPVYMEQRMEKEFMGFLVRGKYDFVAEGRVHDFKTTTVAAYQAADRSEEHIMQGSLYRWLDGGTKITEDLMHIHYLLSDWSERRAQMDKNYPQLPIITHTYELWPIEEAEQFVIGKLEELKRYRNAPESVLPRCNDKDLWRKAPVYQYFSKPDNTRCQAKFTTLSEANKHLAEKGKGLIRVKPGEVVACRYCPAFSECRQKDEYLADGSLTL